MRTVPPGHEVADPLVDSPHPPRAGRSENLVFFGFDHNSGWAYWAHAGRLAPDPSVWEVVLVLLTPNGELLNHRSVGRSVLEPASAELRFECLVPGERWRIRLDGVAQRIAAADTRRRPVSLAHLPGSTAVIDPYEYVQADLEFAGVYPMCDTRVSAGQGWGDLHLHQLGRTVGRVRCAEAVQDLHLSSMRDHTRGARDYSGLGGEWWATCTFPSGRAFDLFQAWTTSGEPWTKGFLWDAAKVAVSTSMQRAPARTADGDPKSFDIVVTDCPGTGPITCEALDVFNYTLIRPTGLAPGHHAVDSDTLIMIEGSARYVWNGEVGYGWIERCRPVKDLEPVS